MHRELDEIVKLSWQLSDHCENFQTKIPIPTFGYKTRNT